MGWKYRSRELFKAILFFCYQKNNEKPNKLKLALSDIIILPQIQEILKSDVKFGMDCYKNYLVHLLEANMKLLWTVLVKFRVFQHRSFLKNILI